MLYPQELSCYKTSKSLVLFLCVFVELVVTEMIRGFCISKLPDIAFRETSSKAHRLSATLLPQRTFWVCLFVLLFFFFYSKFTNFQIAAQKYFPVEQCWQEWSVFRSASSGLSSVSYRLWAPVSRVGAPGGCGELTDSNILVM